MKNLKEKIEEITKRVSLPISRYEIDDVREEINKKIFQLLEEEKPVQGCSDEEFEEILRKKEEHYKLREKLVLRQAKKDWIEDLLKKMKSGISYIIDEETGSEFLSRNELTQLLTKEKEKWKRK